MHYEVEGDDYPFPYTRKGLDEAIRLAKEYASSHPVHLFKVDDETGTRVKLKYRVEVQPPKPPRKGYNNAKNR